MHFLALLDSIAKSKVEILHEYSQAAYFAWASCNKIQITFHNLCVEYPQKRCIVLKRITASYAFDLLLGLCELIERVSLLEDHHIIEV